MEMHNSFTPEYIDSHIATANLSHFTFVQMFSPLSGNSPFYGRPTFGKRLIITSRETLPHTTDCKFESVLFADTSMRPRDGINTGVRSRTLSRRQIRLCDIIVANHNREGEAISVRDAEL